MAVVTMLAIGAAPVQAQVPPPALEPLEVVCSSAAAGNYGFTIELTTGAPLDFTVDVADATDADVGTEALPLTVAANATAQTVLYGPGPTATIGGDTITLEDAVVTVTATPVPATGAITASVVLDCLPPTVDDIEAAVGCASAVGAPNTVAIQNNNTADDITVDVQGAIVSGGSTVIEGPLANNLLIGPGLVQTVEIPLRYTHARIDFGTLPADQILVQIACVAVTTSTASTTATTAASGVIATTTTLASGATIARTGSDNDVMARVGTMLGLLGLVLLLTSHWWMQWWRERETMLAEFHSWRMRGR